MQKYRFNISVLFFIALLLVSSCKISAPMEWPSATKVPATFTGTAPGSTDSLGMGQIRWRDFFTDPYLLNLIDNGLKNNLDLLAALQRIEIARAEIQARKGVLLPTLDLAARAGVEKFGDYTMNGVGNYDTNLSENVRGNKKIPNPTPDFFLGVGSTWEIDLWGKLRNQKKAAYLRLLASQKGRQLVETALIAQIASAYYELLTLDNELEIIGLNIQLQEKAVELIQVQQLAGRVTQLGVQQFTAQLLQTRSLEGMVQQRIVDTENRLNLLMGRFPQPITRGNPIMEQSLPETVDTGIPSLMLRRRPDIQQAELALAASRANVDAARAAFFPSLRLTPYLGFNAFNAAVLFNPGSLAFGLLSSASAPLLNRNVVKASYLRSQAESREAFYAYQKAVFTGFGETLTSLKSIENYRKVAQLKQEQVEVLRQAASTANDLFAAGFASYLEVVTAQKNVLEAELELASIKKQQFLSLITLYRALGGGWE